MEFTIKFWKKETYLPTKRHRKERFRYVEDSCKIDVKEVSEEDFPVAFRVHDYKSVYENAESYTDFDGNGEYKMFTEEIRTYGDKLYMPVRITHGAAVSCKFEPLDYIERELNKYEPYWQYGEDFTENSIIIRDDSEEQINYLRARAEKYLICNGVVWKTCNEPMYMINTFGLGHNHGGTGFFIQYHYNPNISKNNYFNALEREKAIEYGKKVALNRGDTESVEGMGDYDIIEVLMPEMVKRVPNKEHGDGDSFINSLEEMINNTDSSFEAGLLATMMCIKEAAKRSETKLKNSIVDGKHALEVYKSFYDVNKDDKAATKLITEIFCELFDCSADRLLEEG